MVDFFQVEFFKMDELSKVAKNECFEVDVELDSVIFSTLKCISVLNDWGLSENDILGSWFRVIIGRLWLISPLAGGIFLFVNVKGVEM